MWHVWCLSRLAPLSDRCFLSLKSQHCCILYNSLLALFIHISLACLLRRASTLRPACLLSDAQRDRQYPLETYRCTRKSRPPCAVVPWRERRDITQWGALSSDVIEAIACRTEWHRSVFWSFCRGNSWLTKESVLWQNSMYNPSVVFFTVKMPIAASQWLCFTLGCSKITWSAFFSSAEIATTA